MPQVHLKGVRNRVRAETVAGLIQRYTGKGMVESKRIADQVVAEGKEATVYVDDFDAVYDLAEQLVNLGVNAEADESDY